MSSSTDDESDHAGGPPGTDEAELGQERTPAPRNAASVAAKAAAPKAPGKKTPGKKTAGKKSAGKKSAAATVSSPESTGGAGGIYETRVGAIVLTRLLHDDQVPGLGAPVMAARFQQLFAGALLDDIVVEGIDGSGSTRQLELQVKRSIALAVSNAEFRDIIGRCVTAIAAEQQSGTAGQLATGGRRFGIVTKPSQAIKDFDRLTEYARQHSRYQDFFEVIRTATRAGIRERLDQLRATVTHALKGDAGDQPEPADQLVDEATWRVAQALHGWGLDADPQGEGVIAAQDRLADLLEPEQDRLAVFDALVAATEQLVPNAGRVDQASLRNILEALGYAVTGAPRHRATYEKYVNRTTQVLALQRTDLAGQLTLERTSLRADIRSSLLEDNILLTGSAGVGKSVLASLAAVDAQREGAAVLVINLANRLGGIAEIEHEYGGPVREALAGAPVGMMRLLVLDGAEQSLTDAGALLRELLVAAGSHNQSGPRWRVLITARAEAAATIRNHSTAALNGAVRQLVAGDLSEAEVAAILAAFPALGSVAAKPRAAALLLRRPYAVELLVRASTQGDLPADLAGEEDLMDLVTDKLVRRDEGGLAGRGAPDARADIYLALATAAIDNALPASLNGYDAEARAGLSSDDLTRRVRQAWKFAHDVLVDYGVATRLLESDGAALLAAAPNPRRLIRSTRLMMQRLLTDAVLAASPGGVDAVWQELLTQAAALVGRDGSRWNDVPWEALLNSALAREVLSHLTHTLYGDDAAKLSDLLAATLRRARHPVPTPYEDTSTQDGAPVSPQGYLERTVTHLNTALSGPVVEFLVQTDTQVPSTLRRRAIKLTNTHLRASYTFDESPLAGQQYLEGTAPALLKWNHQDTYGDAFRECINSLALLGQYLRAEHIDFMIDRAHDRPHDISPSIEDPLASRVLAATKPVLLLRLAGLYYLGRDLTPPEPLGDEARRPRESRPSDSEGSGDAMAIEQPDPLQGDTEAHDAFEFPDEFDAEERREGVRDHDPRLVDHLPMFPLGNNQSNADLGPFAPLLAEAPEEGLALIGAVVDSASAARTRLEAGFQNADRDIVNMRLGESATTFTGPATAWLWYRRTGVGANPALSALMALRRWASNEVNEGRPLVEVRDAILAAGTSIAFPAVAWSVLVQHLDQVTDEADKFLTHPRVWQLEVYRRVQEHSSIAADMPGMTRTNWTVSEVAVQLVLVGDQDRRETLRRLGEQLRDNADELGPEQADVVERWAHELDYRRYVASVQAQEEAAPSERASSSNQVDAQAQELEAAVDPPAVEDPLDDSAATIEAQPTERAAESSQAIRIEVDYPNDLRSRLEEQAAAANLGLQAAGLLFRAAALRDIREMGEGSEPLDYTQIDSLWSTIQTVVEHAEWNLTPYRPVDLLAAGAAAIIRAAALGYAVNDNDLGDAADLLGDLAQQIGESAPPPPGTDTEGERLHHPTHEMVDDYAADRSVATGLTLLTDPALSARTRLSQGQVSEGLIAAATSPYDEARLRLVQGLLTQDATRCQDHEGLHATRHLSARRLVSSAGYGPRDQSGHGYPPASLPEPLEDLLNVPTTDEILHLGSAAWAIPLLTIATTSPQNNLCEACTRAGQLLEALIQYDRRIFPAKYADRGIMSAHRWRTELDRAIALAVLNGNTELLADHLTAFADTPDQLVGLLTQLPELAITPEQRQQLHLAWRTLLDRLLPASRTASQPQRRRSAYRRRIEELDTALLLDPQENLEGWPWEDTIPLAIEWFAAFNNQPHVADAAIKYGVRVLRSVSPELGASLPLTVLGTNTGEIRDGSRLAVPFLDTVIRNPPTESLRLQAVRLLDSLAAAGDEPALAAQLAHEADPQA